MRKWMRSVSLLTALLPWIQERSVLAKQIDKKPVKDTQNETASAFHEQDGLGVFDRTHINCFPVHCPVEIQRTKDQHRIRIYESGQIHFQTRSGQWKLMGQKKELNGTRSWIEPSQEIRDTFQEEGLVLQQLGMQVVRMPRGTGVWLLYQYLEHDEIAYRDDIFEKPTIQTDEKRIV